MIKRRFVYEVSGFFPYMDNGRLLSLFIYWANTMNMVLDDKRITEE